MSYLGNQLRHLDSLIKQLYDVEYVLFNDVMTLPFQGQGHSIRVTEIEKIAYFGEITGPCSLSVEHCAGWQILVSIFQMVTSSTL